MEYSGKGGSETSSEENDRLEQVKDDMGGTPTNAHSAGGASPTRKPWEGI